MARTRPGMTQDADYAPGNAGIIFWTDFILPVIGFGLQRCRKRAART